MDFHYLGWAGTRNHPEKNGTYPCGVRIGEEVRATSYTFMVTCQGCKKKLTAQLRKIGWA